MSGPVKLYYFNTTGRAEPIRVLLHYGGMKFTDIRLSFPEFSSKKGSFPTGKVPVLEIDGKMIHQSQAICRYLGRKFGLVGKSEWDALECDITVDTIGDLREPLTSFHFEKDKTVQAEKKEVLLSTTIPFYINILETQANKNGGHFVNGQLTWADLYFVSLLGFFKDIVGKDIVADKPALMALKAKVLALKGIKEYMNK